MYRVKQFFKGFLSFLPYENYRLVDKYLNGPEKELFFKLPRHEQRHALDTAATMQKFDIEEDEVVLMKAAILHDIGKAQGKAGIIKKSILVLMHRLLPGISYKLSSKMSMFYIYYNHPQLGAEMLMSVNTDKDVIQLVENHHLNKLNDIKGMELLKRADSLN